MSRVAKPPLNVPQSKPAERGKPDRDLRARILDEATRLFAEQGFSATSVRQVAEACDCTKPSLYYYFDSKETLFREVVDLHFQACNTVIESVVGEATLARQAIHDAVAGYIGWAENNPLALRLLQRIEVQSEEGTPEIGCSASREVHLQMISNLVARGIAAGELSAGIDPGDCALVIAGALSFQFELAISSGDWNREQIHRTVDLIFDGISA